MYEHQFAFVMITDEYSLLCCFVDACAFFLSTLRVKKTCTLFRF